MSPQPGRHPHRILPAHCLPGFLQAQATWPRVPAHSRTGLAQDPSGLCSGRERCGRIYFCGPGGDGGAVGLRPSPGDPPPAGWGELPAGFSVSFPHPQIYDLRISLPDGNFRTTRVPILTPTPQNLVRETLSKDPGAGRFPYCTPFPTLPAQPRAPSSRPDLSSTYTAPLSLPCPLLVTDAMMPSPAHLASPSRGCRAARTAAFRSGSEL